MLWVFLLVFKKKGILLTSLENLIRLIVVGREVPPKTLPFLEVKFTVTSMLYFVNFFNKQITKLK